MKQKISFTIHRIFEKKARHVAELLVLMGSILEVMWIAFDILLVPHLWKRFALLRILVAVISLVFYFLLKKGKVDWRLVSFIFLSGLNIIIAYMIAVVPEEFLAEYFAGFSTVLIVPAFFVYYNWKEYLLMGGIAVMATIGFNFYFGNHSWYELFGNGGLTYFTVGVFGTVFSELKLRTIYSEIEANVKLQVANEELNSLNEELSVTNDRLEEQRAVLEKQNKEIMQSIEYASYLQDAVLNDETLLRKYFQEHFFLFLPRDIVSGDFLWTRETPEGLFVAVADSTGHGVPGAMVSIFCNNALNEAVNNLKKPTPADILNYARKYIKTAFSQKGRNIKDGMDITILFFPKNDTRALFAGANNSVTLYFPGNQEKTVKLKGDRMPVGTHYIEKDFSNKIIDLTGCKNIYFYSDGYIDQFGGDKGKKLMYKNFERLLLEIAENSMEAQADILRKFLDKWSGNNPQTDDITVLGVKLIQ